MKKSLLRAALTFLAVCVFNLQPATARAQGTAFTYQGRLDSGGTPANGSYDIAFTLFATNAGGVAIAGPVTNAAVGVTNGLFTTTVDLGSAFTGASNWLEIAVSTNAANAFFTLAPRQQLTPTPYAVFAESANAGGLIGTVSGNGGGLTNLNAVNLNGTVTTANLPATVALLDASQTFSGINNFSSSVGIGTTLPSAPLEIQDNGGRNLVMSGPGGAEWSFYDTTASTYDWDISGGPGTFLISSSGIGYPFAIDRASGNVGINTTTPRHTLDVAGNIRLGLQAEGAVFTELGDTLYLGSSRKYLANTLGAPVNGNTDWINLMAHPLSAGIMFGLSGPSDADPHSAPVPLMVIQSNGSVGIGTVNPVNLLTVSNNNSPAISLIGSSGNGQLDLGIAGFATAYSTSAGANDAVIRQSGLGNLFLQTGSGAAAIAITTNNNVGIGTSAPSSDSLLQVKGMMRMGSETGTSEAPNKPILLRRINSSSSALGQIVAKGVLGNGGLMTLERDGTTGGLIFKYAGGAAPQIMGHGLSGFGGTNVNVYAFFGGGGAGTNQVFTDSQRIGYCRLTFGDALNNGDVTTVEMIRAADSVNNTVPWVGTVISTANQ